jgi:hypothetical protein
MLLFGYTVTYSWQARPVRVDIVWPTAKAVGRGGVHRTQPAKTGGIGPREKPYVALRGAFCKRETIIPTLFALGHIMAALTGLAGADTNGKANSGVVRVC